MILERTYQVPFLEHAYLEPDIVMAIPQPDGTMLIEGPMQAPFTTRRNVNAVLGVPINRVRVRQISMGGGFGGKEDSPIDLGCRAAVLAYHTGRPVRMALDREEVTLQTSKRHPMIMEVKDRGQERTENWSRLKASSMTNRALMRALARLSPRLGAPMFTPWS